MPFLGPFLPLRTLVLLFPAPVIDGDLFTISSDMDVQTRNGLNGCAAYINPYTYTCSRTVSDDGTGEKKSGVGGFFRKLVPSKDKPEGSAPSLSHPSLSGGSAFGLGMLGGALPEDPTVMVRSLRVPWLMER